MHLRSGVAWVALHSVPLVVFPLVIRAAVRTVNPELLGPALYLLLAIIVVVGQTATIRGVKGWGIQSALGLCVAGIAGMVLPPLLDGRLHFSKLAAVGITHAASGAGLAALQAMTIRGPMRWTWIAASTATWGLGAALAVRFYAAPWLPALSGAFPGRVELTTIVWVLPVYAGMTLAAVRYPLAR